MRLSFDGLRPANFTFNRNNIILSIRELIVLFLLKIVFHSWVYFSCFKAVTMKMTFRVPNWALPMSLVNLVSREFGQGIALL